MTKKNAADIIVQNFGFLRCALTDTERWCVFPHCIFKSTVMCTAKNFLTFMIVVRGILA